jgi:hypoxanthine-guanine phosphoribosyltransferase
MNASYHRNQKFQRLAAATISSKFWTYRHIIAVLTGLYIFHTQLTEVIAADLYVNKKDREAF